jgi:hypothetical protein
MDNVKTTYNLTPQTIHEKEMVRKLLANVDMQFCMKLVVCKGRGFGGLPRPMGVEGDIWNDTPVEK